jgi:hypothetical protein
MLAALAGLTGAAGGIFNPAATGVMPLIVPRELLQQANGMRATALSAGEIAGPVLAGVLIATVGPGWALAVDAASFAVSAAFLLRLRLPPVTARVAATFLADLREGWSVFSSMTWVWAFVAAVAFGNLVWGAWSVLGPVVAPVIAFGALPRRGVDDARQRCLGVDAAGPRPRRVPEPRERLRLVRLARLHPVGMAIWGPIAALIGISAALWVAALSVLFATLLLVSLPAIRQLQA